jgi:peptidoglycan/xylan/chitin deacetylase (PgdA/CDA1 family)
MIAHASTDPSRHCKTAYVRSPYGDESPAALAAVVADGYNVDVRWTVDSLGWNDREESLARGLLRGIAAFFHVPLPPWALRPRDAPMNLGAVVPPG